MYKKSLYMLLIGIFIVGCKEEVPDEPPPPPPPKPLTPQQIAAKIITELQLDAPLPAAGSSIPSGLTNKLKSSLNTHRDKHSPTESGKEALNIVSRKIESRVRQCVNNEVWAYVILVSDLHLILNPGSVKFNANRIRAIAELSRPIVVIRGIIIDGDGERALARLVITLPLKNETVTESMKLGDLMYGIRFIEVIGTGQGIVFEYVETGERFDVLTKNASR